MMAIPIPDDVRELLVARPVGEPRISDWKLAEAGVPEADGEFVVEVTHISLDPAMRGWMNAELVAAED